MFPLRDSIPRRYVPYAARAIIVVNTLVFLFELSIGQEGVVRLFYIFGVVPARFMHPDWAAFVGYPDTGVIPFFTHMFLHSGFLHFLANMWILWVFSDNVEDVMGPWRFVVFYMLCGLVALAGHFVFNLNSTMPVVGASGAIAGVMGAYLLLYPRAQVLTLIPVFIFPFFVDLPAVVFLGLWFLMQILSGVFASLSSQAAGGVAWWAHSFGFLAGILLVPFFRSSTRCTDCGRSTFDDFRFH